MRPVIPLLREELADVEAGAADAARQEARWQNVRIRKSEKAARIRALLAMYEAENETGEAADPQPETSAEATPDDSSGHWEKAPASPPAESEFELSPVPAKALSKAKRVMQETANLLRVYGTRHRSQILEHLIATGVMGHEKSPIASLAAYLSDHREMFVPDGRGNFTLRQDAGGSHGTAQSSSPTQEANPT